MPRRITPPPLKKRLARTRKRTSRRLKLALVPHKHNQYRPHLIRTSGLVVLMLLALGLQAGYNVSTGGTVLGSHAAVTPAALLSDTNAQRQSNGLPPLTGNAKLGDAAYMKAQDMFAKQYWAHVAPDGTTPWQWFGKVGYNYAYAGENLAKNFTTADAATTAWMASPEHRANILDKHYTDVGFAVVSGELNDRPTTLIVALYGEPATATAAVAGVTDSAPMHGVGLLTRLRVALESLTPAAIIASLMLLLAAAVALIAHFYRHKLPRVYRQTWHRSHHGLLKVGGMMALLVVVLSMYSGGSI